MRYQSKHPVAVMTFSIAAFFVTSVPALRAQQSVAVPATVGAQTNPVPTLTLALSSNNSNSSSEQEQEPDPAIALAPQWVTSSDSLGNIRQQIKIKNEYAVAKGFRLGLLFAQSYVYGGDTNVESFRDTGMTGQWRPNQNIKLNVMAGISQLGAATNSNGQSSPETFLPIADVHATYTSTGENLKVDLGFKRSIFDLSPELVANRVVRNDFVIHPQIGLQSGWRFRELAEIGPVVSAEGNNYRYNSEFTVARQLAKNSELYSSLTVLHYARPSEAGYFSPRMVHDLEGGWSTDIDRKVFTLSFDCGMGAGHAKEYGSGFGAWGLSAHSQTDFTFKIHSSRDLHATYEFYYDKSAPPIQSARAGPWHMNILTVSFDWSWRKPETERLHSEY